MAKWFVVVDMQNDFVSGALANPAAEAIVPAIQEAAEKALADGAKLIFTLDTHYDDYMKTGEGKHLPVEHCIEGTDGWRIIEDLQDLADEAIILPKEHFGSNKWTEYVAEGDEVTMCGTCTDICVVSNALALKQIEGVEVNVIANACAGLSPETHKAALDVMKCCQCNIIQELK